MRQDYYAIFGTYMVKYSGLCGFEMGSAPLRTTRKSRESQYVRGIGWKAPLSTHQSSTFHSSFKAISP